MKRKFTNLTLLCKLWWPFYLVAQLYHPLHKGRGRQQGGVCVRTTTQLPTMWPVPKSAASLVPRPPPFFALFRFRSALYWTQTKERKRGRPGNEASLLQCRPVGFFLSWLYTFSGSTPHDGKSLMNKLDYVLCYMCTFSSSLRAHKNGWLERKSVELRKVPEFIVSTKNSNTYAQLCIDMLLSMCRVFYF